LAAGRGAFRQRSRRGDSAWAHFGGFLFFISDNQTLAEQVIGAGRSDLPEKSMKQSGTAPDLYQFYPPSPENKHIFSKLVYFLGSFSKREVFIKIYGIFCWLMIHKSLI
jgi:hypothetical protein